ncbi:hypothetical protein [Desulfotalea psychrophila]|uniref:Uncharacterized protein n=1 Tax=Desulfotalea psychrophila (strain LSv54 / DSM 12343) TaxID=177439 RepID=Q6AJ66_DESPS|nr:hypothetical protein [Desulfotalea psychrophila]CAG37614.1 unknown protein [Desulfotalea psychrophila LSv54]
MSDSQIENDAEKSRLIVSLREGVALVQMIFFKELRTHLTNNYSDKSKRHNITLTSTITNEIFGTPNPEESFVHFHKENWAIIEQELLTLKENFPLLLPSLTDALRIQTLCDSQEGQDSSAVLVKANNFGFLLEEREVPLPSNFITAVRTIGGTYNLIIPPVQVNPEQEAAITH